MKNKAMELRFLLLAILVCLGSATIAKATPSSGWEFTVDMGNTFFGHVTVVPDYWNEEVLVIEIFKEFKSPEFSEWGLGQALWIQCKKVSETAPSTIIIQDERVTNNTRRDWYDFHIQLGADLNDEDQVVSFDTNYEFQPGGPDNPNPFSSFAYNYQPFKGQNLPLRADLTNGIHHNGDTSQLGGPSSGHLAIVTEGMSYGDVFWIKEYPTVPEPATMSMLVLGGLALLRRKRA